MGHRVYITLPNLAYLFWELTHILQSTVFGASFGESRLSRQTIFEKPDNIHLARRTIEIFSKLQKQTGLELLAKTGFYYIEESPTDLHGHGQVFDKMAALANSHGVSIDTNPDTPEFLTVESKSRRILDNTGYVLKPTNCVNVLQSEAISLGAVIINNKAALQMDNSIIRVVVGDQALSFQNLIVSAGFNNNQVLEPLEISLPYQVCPQRMYWYQIESSYRSTYEKYFKPTVKVFTVNGVTRFFYSFLGVDGKTIKIGTETYRDKAILDSRAFYQQYVASNFIGVTNRLVKFKDCNYSVTTDHDFIFKSLDKYPNITAISACSGQGFKFSAAYGEKIVNNLGNGLNLQTSG